MASAPTSEPIGSFVIGSSGVASALSDASGGWGYALVFVLAAIPWFEILLVIPPAIALGFDPVAVGVLAFLGNVLPIYGIVAFHDRLTRWWVSRRSADGDEDENEGERTESKRRRRAKHVWNRYGLPGLALAAPIVTGVHLAAVIALGLRTGGRDVALWMTASIALWTVVLVVASVAGVAALGW